MNQDQPDGTTAPGINANQPAIDVRGLSKKFGRHAALTNVTLTVAPGRCLVLFGPNGAGKTTLIKVLSTLAVPTSGTALICGHDIRHQPGEVRRQVGVLSHESFLYDAMAAAENLRFFAKMHGAPASAEHIDSLLKHVGMLERAHSPVGTMSRGMMQRVALARCLLHDPQVILLDEPYSGLDPHGAQILTQYIKDLRSRGCSMLVTTHQLSTGLDVADDVAILARGKLCYRAAGDDIRHDDFRQEYATAVSEVQA